MVRDKFIRRLTTLVLLVATLGSQAPGVAVRFLCECSGEVFVTFHDHCHDAADDGAPQGHGHGHDDSGSDHRPHEPIAELDHLSQSEPSAKAPDAKTVCLGQAAVSKSAARLEAPVAQFSALAPPGDLGPPPLALMVARAVVRLV